MKKLLVFGSLLVACAANAASPAYQKAMQEAQQKAQTQQYDAARISLQAAQAAAQTEEEKTDVLITLGQTYNDENNYLKAREIWQQVLQSQSASATQKLVSRYSTAGSYLAEKRFVEARTELTKVISDPAADAGLVNSARLALAGSYQDEKDFEKAAEALKTILTDGKSAPAFKFLAQQGLAENAFLQGDFERARAEFTKATQLEGIDVTEKAMAQARIVETYRRQGDVKQANFVSAGFESALVKQARDAFVAKNYQQARVFFASALIVAGEQARPPYSAGLREKIGECYLGDGQFEQAQTELQAVLDFKPVVANQDAGLEGVRQVAQLMMAVSYTMEGNKERAKAEYQKTLQLPNLNPGLRTRAEQGLAKLTP